MRASAILWIAALGGACGDDAKQPGSTAAPEPAISETRLPTASGDIVLRLLDQGAEPRRLLRYDLKDWKGGKAAMEMEISLAMRMEEDEEPRRMDIPPVRMVMAYSPVVETEDGNLRTEFSMEVAEMDPDSPLAEDRGMDIKGWTVMTPSGHVKDVGFELPEDTEPAVKRTMDGLRQTLQQLATPFPGQPVGKGGRWELIAPMEVMGMRFEGRVAYRLEEFTEHGGRTTVEMSVTGSGTFVMPGNEEMKAKIESMRADGTGTFAFDLRSLIPDSTMETRMSMKLLIGTEGTVEQDLTMKMKFSRAE